MNNRFPNHSTDPKHIIHFRDNNGNSVFYNNSGIDNNNNAKSLSEKTSTDQFTEGQQSNPELGFHEHAVNQDEFDVGSFLSEEFIVSRSKGDMLVPRAFQNSSPAFHGRSSLFVPNRFLFKSTPQRQTFVDNNSQNNNDVPSLESPNIIHTKLEANSDQEMARMNNQESPSDCYMTDSSQISTCESSESSQSSCISHIGTHRMDGSVPMYKSVQRKYSQKDFVGSFDLDGRDISRQRSAPREQLYFMGHYCETGPWSRIRVWMNSKNQIFYDCMCARRVPIQHLKKIKHHAESHDVKQFVCETCGREFDHYLKRNAHQKTHKRSVVMKDC
jgi:hypothetical protein